MLKGGKTAHSAFKIPLQVDSDTVCRVSKQSSLAAEIKKLNLIIWDEASMIEKNAYHSVLNSLKDIMGEKAFEKLTILFCGDFRQTLIGQKGADCDKYFEGM